MEELDRRLVQAAQAGLAIVAEPYKQLATELGCSEAFVLERLQAMRDDGRIRRIGVVPNHYRLGYTANGMSVWDVADERSTSGGRAGRCAGYRQSLLPTAARLPDWPYNLFAMVHGHSRAEVRTRCSTLRSCSATRARGHDVLFSTRILKKTGLRSGRRLRSDVSNLTVHAGAEGIRLAPIRASRKPAPARW